MINKIKINKIEGKFYEYSINVMGREVVLLTKAEFLQLYGKMSDIILDDKLME